MLANVIKRRKELLEKLGVSLDLISTPPARAQQSSLDKSVT
jgi:hypothetical protein